MFSLALSIGLISFLNRREELIVPSCPAESIITLTALLLIVVTPRMLPIKQVLPTAAPAAPIQITLLAVKTPCPALLPRPILLLPVSLIARALAPMAVLVSPVVLLESAPTPLAVLRLPVSLAKSAP